MAARGGRLRRHDQREIDGWEALIGVDEAGRGALAGPVCAGAVMAWPEWLRSDAHRSLQRRIDDSKVLPAEERAAVATALRAVMKPGLVLGCTAFASVAEIEERNILGATQLAMQRALRLLWDLAGVDSSEADLLFPIEPADAAGTEGEGTGRSFARLPIDRCRILVDGRPLDRIGCAHDALVGGDGRSLVIAAASILAKVDRDAELTRLDRAHPGYGLIEHKGYGTPEHRTAILRLGPAPVHRDRFLRRLQEEAGRRLAAAGQLELGLDLAEAAPRRPA